MTEDHDDESFRIMMRRVAELEIVASSESRRALIDEHSAAFRWLVASLLAINGGAAIATLTADGLPTLMRLWACGSYYFGVMFALLTAWHSQRSVRATIAPLSKVSGFWIEVAETGVYDSESWNQVQQELNRAIRKTRWTQLSGWLSATAFTSGAAATAFLFLLPALECRLDQKLSQTSQCVTNAATQASL